MTRNLNPLSIFKTNLEIHFSFQASNNDYKLGQLGISPYSELYKISRVDFQSEK
jgi:hypothetical protein